MSGFQSDRERCYALVHEQRFAEIPWPEDHGIDIMPMPSDRSNSSQLSGSQSGTRFDVVCDAFARAWRSGAGPRIEDYLNQASDDVRDALLLELIREELSLRKHRGDQVDIADYQSRFPGDLETVARAFSSMGDPSRFESTLEVPAIEDSVSPQSISANGASSAERYRKIRQLGAGAFGNVWLAEDAELGRQVAIKEPREDRISSGLDIATYISEARVLASLDHPNIVPVYDVGHSPSGSCYVVSKWIDGLDLSAYIAQHPHSFERIASLIAQVADALQQTHQRGVVHRDIKPANILVDRNGHPYVADFGLALREENFDKPTGIVGTPAYMSPEQARGEGHLVDGRSDIFSLGIVLYELLTGVRPFRGKDWKEVLAKVKSSEPKPLRQRNESIPRELERICLKALAKRPADRYDCAADLAEDLRSWSTSPGALKQRVDSIRMVPKGLRSFDASDREFFLDLLPGARDRDGLPESLRFWKERIEETDSDRTFRVGLVYGPSGCGKSSLMKAGLLPRLNSKIVSVYVESTAEGTEDRILQAVKRAIPDAEGESLTDALSSVRRNKLVPSGGKLLLVLDQFEQWLFAESDYADASLTKALAQCDGATVQAIILVRDDFWISVSRFLRELGIPILERQNSSMVDLFNLEHAAKVLGMFGKAYGKLPDNENDWNSDQHEFVRQAVQGLSQDRMIIPVRLSVFADMMKLRKWSTAALGEVGGTEGVGVTFLEEMFGSRHAPIQHRQHQEAVRGLLATLLPATGTDIKGSMQSAASLQKAAGYANKAQEFQDLIEILDKSLRLITPVDDGSLRSEGRSEKSDTNSNTSLPSSAFYQLAHDYLVPSIREWLTRKQLETKKGRAELKLAERAAAWSINPENKQLPTLMEWFQIRRLTEPSKWKTDEKSVMQQATRHHVQRVALAAAAVLLASRGAWFAWRESTRQQEATRIAGLVDTLINAEPAQIPKIVEQLASNPKVADEYLTPRLFAEAKTPNAQRVRLHARLASVARDSSLVKPLVEELLTGKVNYVLPIRQLLKPSAAKLRESLLALLKDEKADAQRRFRAALALADDVPNSDEATWTESTRTFVAQQLVSSNPDFQPILREALRPIQGKLLTDLERIFNNAAATASQRLSAATALADYAVDDRSRLTQLLTLATPEQYKILYPLVSAVPSPDTIAELSEVVATSPPTDLGSVQRIALGQRRANAAVTMLKLGEKEKILPVFDWTDDPEAMTQFIFRCKPRSINIETLLDLLDITTRSVSEGSDAAASTLTSSTSLAHPSGWDRAGVRYALLLALGEYAPTEIPPTRRDALVKQLADWYANDPNSGIHGAAGWLLRYLGEKETADRVDQTPVPYSPEREWFTLAITVKPTPPPKPNPEDKAKESDPNETEPKKPDKPSESLPPKTFYYTFVVHPSGEFTISSVEDEAERDVKMEARHTVTLTRPFALLDREITIEEITAFTPEYEGLVKVFGNAPNDAGFGMRWYDSVAFCRWLGSEMGLPETDQCYADPATLDEKQYPRDPVQTSFPKNWPLDLSKRGFRLPTESEWEVMTRSGLRTSYGFGSDAALLEYFGWYVVNSNKTSHSGREKRPSVRGLFDLHGNLFEWTHDWFVESDFGKSNPTDPLGAETGSRRVIRGGAWNQDAVVCRTANRRVDTPSNQIRTVGLRLALCPSNPTSTGSAESGAEDATSPASEQRREE